MDQTPGVAARLPDDRFGAFCHDNHVAIAGAPRGPLAGLTFAAKDVFDIRGHRTGFGHPVWLASHPPAGETAEAVAALLGAGASLVGKTVSDELCYSLSGENAHYGMPINPRAPNRVPGGSSSGSAVAVAAGVVDFSIGTDCGGSVRVPASYCGILGMRPTYGRVSLHGAHRFAESFDCLGWFAHTPDVLMRAGRTLLAATRPAKPFRRLIIADDAFARADAAVREAIAEGLNALSRVVGHTEHVTLSPQGLETWFEAFRVIQAAEIWRSLGGWITQHQPELGPGVRERFEAASAITPAQVREAEATRQAVIAHLEATIGPGDVVCFPTTPRPAPLRGSPTDEVEITYRHRAMELLCASGLAGLPQITLPLGVVEEAPVGLSVMARPGADMDLLDLAGKVCTSSASDRGG